VHQHRSAAGGKSARIEDAYATLKDPSSPHRVVCFDEHGPLQPIPHRGRSWQPRRRPRGQRSTYRRNQGTRQLLAVLCPRDGHVVSALRSNRRKQTVLSFLLPTLEHELDSLPSHGKLYAILDNLNIHHAAEVDAWAAAPERCDRLELCYTPTNGSWLNLVESFFRLLDRRVYAGTDYRTMDELESAFEAGLATWNAQPTPFTWRGKRWQRRRRRQPTICPLTDPSTPSPMTH
jgi:DDE superfamily endonuclease